MENLSNKITNAVNELKETINSAVAEIKNTIKTNLDTFENVKSNLSNAYAEMEELFAIADDLSISMEMVAEDTNSACEDLEEVLAVIDPDNFGDFEEDFEEEDEDYIVVEDTESGDETEYPIN